MNDQEHFLTPEGAERLREELEHLKGPVREDLAKRLRSAIQMGDLSENADYIATKEQQGFIEGRIQELEYLLRYATIIDNNGDKREKVDLGVRVTIQQDDFPPETYQVVGAKEANPRDGRISYESPFGRALMGKGVGEQVIAQTPTGNVKLKILNIE